MKILIRIFFTLIIFVSFHYLIYGSECAIDYNNDCLTNDQTDEQMQGYTIGVGVWYGYCEIKCADKTTFKPIKLKNEEFEFFGKDKNHFFFRDTALEGINPNGYKIKETGKSDYYLIYDKDTVYLNTILFSQIDPATFKFLDTSYETHESWFKDKNHVYRLIEADDSLNNKLEILSDSDPAFFTFGFNITPNAVYWYGKKIEGVDVGSFKVKLEWGNEIATDKNNVYEKGEVMYGMDVKSFQMYQVDTNDTGAVFPLSKNNISIFKKEYPSSAQKIDQSLSTAVKEYETKYPNYTPQPAMPKPDSPEEQALKKFEADVAKAELEETEANKQNMMKLGIIGIVSALGLGGIVYGVMKWMGEGKK